MAAEALTALDRWMCTGRRKHQPATVARPLPMACVGHSHHSASNSPCCDAGLSCSICCTCITPLGPSRGEDLHGTSAQENCS